MTPISETNSNTPNYTELTYQDLKNNKSVFQIVQNMLMQKSGVASKGGVYNETFQMELDTTKIIKIEQNDTRYSLTFKIIDEADQPTITRNLVLDAIEQNTFYAYIFEYNLNEDDRIAYKLGELNNVINQTQIYRLNTDYTLTPVTHSADPCFEVNTITVPAQPCAAGDHMSGQVCPWEGSDKGPQEAYSYISLTATPCDDGGYSPPNPFGPGSDDIISNPWANPDLGGAGDGTSEDNTTTYPGNPNNGDTGNEEETVSTLTTIPLLEVNLQEDETCQQLKK